ncbi:hypothetical protein [Streptomyces brasiliensis]|uniref:Uncharacterized protein n=1 Tax=Streptomyces brasiliensis TaxID=1954 RepID=A0A917P9F2_9ACTN|nr:hypothetical protein [Streptomyces brasiliensis]GGJ67617.1 hypothetical protein GCM10010121_092920 [Streptomyces brasiliensis]
MCREALAAWVASRAALMGPVHPRRRLVTRLLLKALEQHAENLALTDDLPRAGLDGERDDPFPGP